MEHETGGNQPLPTSKWTAAVILELNRLPPFFPAARAIPRRKAGALSTGGPGPPPPPFGPICSLRQGPVASLPLHLDPVCSGDPAIPAYGRLRWFSASNSFLVYTNGMARHVNRRRRLFCVLLQDFLVARVRNAPQLNDALARSRGQHFVVRGESKRAPGPRFHGG